MVFYGFDRIMFLSKGRVVYFGSVSKMELYFVNIGYLVLLGDVIVEYMLNVVNLEFSDFK